MSIFRFIIIAIVLIAAATAYSFLALEGTLKQAGPEPGDAGPAPASPPVPSAPEPGDTEQRQRRAAMRAEYDKLEQAREAVRQRLGVLNSRAWKLRVAPGRARAIREQMQQGYALLKNPPLLGAFSSVGEIADEIEKVQGVNDRLKTLEAEVAKHLEKL